MMNFLNQDTNERLPTLSKAFLLPLIPFCLLGFFNSLFILCGSQILKRTMNRASLVSFLGKTEEERTMGVDMTRVFCYSVLQLTFQVSVPILSARTDRLRMTGDCLQTMATRKSDLAVQFICCELVHPLSLSLVLILPS